MNIVRIVKVSVLCTALAVVFIGAFSAIVMWLWNAILPEVSGVRPLTYWQAAGLLALAKILFGGWWGGGRNRCRPTGGHREDSDRWHALTPQQREEMRAEIRRRFGDWPAPGCSGGPSSPGG
jgi:hypothetical protein